MGWPIQKGFMALNLIIPDIHEKLDKLQIILNTYGPKVDAMTLTGDWFDKWGKFEAPSVIRACAIINNLVDGRYEVEEGKVIPATLLVGNHDCHYLFSNDGFVCSGFDVRRREIITELISHDPIRKFKLHHRIGAYLLSHAGYNYGNIHLANPDYDKLAIDEALAGKFPNIFAPGKARGGDAKIGGPTWQDWNYEFEHINTVPQIVGHTNGSRVRLKHDDHCKAKLDVGSTFIDTEAIEECDCWPSYCIDTGLKHVAIIDDETNAVEIIEV